MKSFREIAEASNKKLDDLFKYYKKEAKGDLEVLHNLILKNFVNNAYARSSNNETEYMWSLYKKEK